MLRYLYVVIATVEGLSSLGLRWPIREYWDLLMSHFLDGITISLDKSNS